MLYGLLPSCSVSPEPGKALLLLGSLVTYPATWNPEITWGLPLCLKSTVTLRSCPLPFPSLVNSPP